MDGNVRLNDPSAFVFGTLQRQVKTVIITSVSDEYAYLIE